IRVDALGLMTLVAATALIARRQFRPDRSSLLLAAAAIGVAAAANYPGALLLLVLGWLEWTRKGEESGRARMRVVTTHCTTAGGAALAVFLVLNPYVLIDLPTFVGWFGFQARVAFVSHPHAEEPSPWRYLLLVRAQGVPAIAACAAGAIAAARPRRACGAI